MSSIRVTCPGCHTRFNVSEKFAGKEGPCPKCKKVIRVPEKAEEVVIHAPELGPKDKKGRPVLKPIERDETSLSSVQIVLLVAVIVGFFLLAFVMRLMVNKENFPQFLLWIGAIGVAVPVVFGTYSFLRDQERGSYLGKELWLRVGICSSVYAALWLAMPLASYAFDGYEPTSWGIAIGAMIGLGGAFGMMLLDFDYLIGLVHASIYFGICFLGRFIVGIGVLPGMQEADAAEGDSVSMLASFLPNYLL